MYGIMETLVVFVVVVSIVEVSRGRSAIVMLKVEVKAVLLRNHRMRKGRSIPINM